MSPIIGINDNRLNLARVQHSSYPTRDYGADVSEEVAEMKRSLEELRMAIQDMGDLAVTENTPGFLMISTVESIEVINPQEIIRLEADGNYTYIYTKDRNRITASKSLKTYEDKLRGENFIRCHQSHMINIREIARYNRTEGGYIEMRNCDRIPVSRKKKNEILTCLGHHAL